MKRQRSRKRKPRTHKYRGQIFDPRTLSTRLLPLKQPPTSAPLIPPFDIETLTAIIYRRVSRSHFSVPQVNVDVRFAGSGENEPYIYRVHDHLRSLGGFMLTFDHSSDRKTVELIDIRLRRFHTFQKDGVWLKHVWKRSFEESDPGMIMEERPVERSQVANLLEEILERVHTSTWKKRYGHRHPQEKSDHCGIVILQPFANPVSQRPEPITRCFRWRKVRNKEGYTPYYYTHLPDNSEGIVCPLDLETDCEWVIVKQYFPNAIGYRRIVPTRMIHIKVDYPEASPDDLLGEDRPIELHCRIRRQFEGDEVIAMRLIPTQFTLPFTDLALT